MTMKIMALVCLWVMVLAAQPLRLESTIPLPDVNGRIAHMSIDVAGKRLFVSALGNNTVEVVDLATGKVVHSIRGLRAARGFLLGGHEPVVCRQRHSRAHARYRRVDF